MNMNIIRNIAIAVISNIIFDPFFPQLMKNKFKSNVEIQTIPFAQCAEHEFVEQLSTSDLIKLRGNVTRYTRWKRCG